MNIQENGQKYNVVFLDGTGINPGTRFKKSPSYSGISSDYQKTFTVLETLRPEIFLAYHTEAFDLGNKKHRSEKEGVKTWVDPIGYKRRVAQSKKQFEKLLGSEK